MSKIETGKQLPTPADIEAWAAATGADAGELLGLLDRARIDTTFRDRFVELGADRAQDAIAAAELAAGRIAHYEPNLIPGILQTADYARELLHLPSGPARSGVTEEEINRMIASRLRRQAILYEPDRDITLLLGEGALRTRLASPTTMRAQLEHIARLAETLTAATIGVIPFTSPAAIATTARLAAHRRPRHHRNRRRQPRSRRPRARRPLLAPHAAATQRRRHRPRRRDPLPTHQRRAIQLASRPAFRPRRPASAARIPSA